jgi:alpha-L-fucosidase 2
MQEKKTYINKSLRWIEKKGTRNWCGYSFSWMGCMYARAKEGDNAADMLKKFATNFVSSNSFHLNGDQKGGQYSNFTYRPFTLEGNFAFAQGIHELLLQSHKGFIEIFPAVPKDWHNISFKTLRTEGAFLISAKKRMLCDRNGQLKAKQAVLCS